MAMTWGLAVKNIRNILKEYLVKNNLKSLVIGESGGIDSALVTVLAKPVCRDLNIPMIGCSLPQATNLQAELDRAATIGRCFCTEFVEVPIDCVFSAYKEFILNKYSENESDRFNKIALGNIKARIRMGFLFDVAYRRRGMVLSTDNLTELLLGFWTLHGDVGNYGMIQNLWKTEVYELSAWLRAYELEDLTCNQALKACEDAVPTDGLGITNSDLDQLGEPTYLQVDNILKTWLTTDIDSYFCDDYLKYPGRIDNVGDFFNYRETLSTHPVIVRHIATGFKRKDPLNLTREQIFTY